jgi:hypothetical protein
METILWLYAGCAVVQCGATLGLVWRARSFGVYTEAEYQRHLAIVRRFETAIIEARAVAAYLHDVLHPATARPVQPPPESLHHEMQERTVA